MQDDRSSNVGGEREGASAEDHTGGRDLRLSARSLAARGEAPGGGEDGRDAPAADRKEPAQE